MRSIESKLVKYIDDKLAKNGLAQEAIKTKDARTVFRLACEALVGIREKSGRNDGPMVELIQETIGRASGEAWCASYIQSCIAYAEVKTGIESPIYPSEHCMTVWNKTSKKQRVKKIPAAGAIAIWNYPPSSNGHTGCVLEFEHKPGQMILCEGNTTSGLKPNGEIERNGGGSYRTERPIKGTKTMVLVGFLKPF